MIFIPATEIGGKSSGSPLPTDFLHELGAAVLLNGRFGGGLSNVDLTGITNVHESTRHPGNGTPGVGLNGRSAIQVFAQALDNLALYGPATSAPTARGARAGQLAARTAATRTA